MGIVYVEGNSKSRVTLLDISVKDLQVGTYLLELVFDGERVTRRLVVSD
ncbi:MAG: hypothetical protein AAFO02_14630 [Bacteroidota bacterium]